MTVIVEDDQPEPDKMMQLASYQSRRRLSTSWTGNLDSPSEQKSPLSVKSPDSKTGSSRSFFPRSAEVHPYMNEESPSLNDVAKDERKDEKHDRRTTKRDSIKDQLMRFKIKAGKVLEDVHDRLVEDHSSAAVAPIMPPETPLQDQTSMMDMDESISIDDRVKSPTLSQSSKRTSTSAELKASMRTKLRKQAEQTVERKRGSVQLAKRLQRRLTIHQEEGPTEGELKSVDEQIERALEIGARFLQEQASMNPPDDVQYSFFVEDEDQEPHPPATGSILEYRRGEIEYDVDQDHVLHYRPNPLDLEANRQQINSSLAMQLLPHGAGTSRIQQLPFVTALKIMQREDTLYNYVKAEAWKTFLGKLEGSDYIQLDLFLSVIYFEQHPLIGDEDKFDLRLRIRYDEQCQRISDMTDVLMDAENLPISENASDIRDHAEALYNDVRKVSDELLSEYAALENCRNRQGYTISPLKYCLSDDDENRTILGKLTADNPVTPLAALPTDERKRIEAMRQKSIQVALYFNDIFICKSKTMPLEGFHYRFDQLYNLEIVSEPKTIHVAIVEKEGTNRKNIAKVNIPLPVDNETTKDCRLPHRIPFESVDKTVAGFLLARATWSTESRTKERREKESPEQSARAQSFSLIPPEVRLVSDEEFEANSRWDALERRFQNRNAVGRIPVDTADTDASSIVNREDRPQRTTFRTIVDSMRAIGLANAVNLRKRLLEREHDAYELTYSEIVREEPLPSLFGAIGSIFGPVDVSRKLKPMRRLVPRQQNISTTTLQLMVNIQVAANLPTRNDGQIHPFVEVSFQNNSMCTHQGSGRHPNWQHSLSLPVSGADDPKSITDTIQLNVYDQIVSTLDKDDREVNTVHEQLLRRLIGWVEVPFSTAFAMGKIDGWLRIKRLNFHTGYSMPDRPSYIKILVAFNPPIIPSRITPQRRVESLESEKILSQCHVWSNTCSSMYESRRYVALVADINGKSVLASRFISPVPPPSSVPKPTTEPMHSVKIAAQLVSMIPFVTDPSLFPGSTDVWTTIEKFLSIGCGDEEEHAVLLCCWLLSLRIPSCLVLGSGLPEGLNAAYVLVNMHDGIYLVNPCNGCIYSSADTMCPIISVGTIITPTNIYGNVQLYSHPSQMNFDLNKTSDWRPVFDKQIVDLRSVQSATISYTQVSEDALVELRSAIEREIKLCFDEARQYGIPQWNLMASRLLREIIQDEQSSLDQRLARLRESYTVTASSITIPYKNIQDCVNAVMRCSIHTTTSVSTQFALAVHLQPAFDHVIICNIGVGMLTLRK